LPGSRGTIQPVPATSSKKVLYVQPLAGGEVERLLDAMQAPFKQCAGGKEAVTIAASRPLSCVLTPLQLADMSATKLIDALQQAAPGLKVIVIADNPAVSEAVAVMQAGAHAVVDSRRLSTGLYHHVAPLLRGA
jgi:DNA-binding NtrC family response regulator